jgi:predicted nucleotidyltransferase component of viral defense system
LPISGGACMSEEKYRIQSLKHRLKNLSEEKNISFDYILLIYMNEGLLHRLEVSRFNRNLILKGGFLLSSMLSNLGRTTRDLDFLGKGIGNDIVGMIEMFTEICQIPYDDLLTFQIKELDAIVIKEDNIYSGIRIIVPCFLDRSKHILQVDIGFGDIITPQEKQFELPVVLHEKPINLYVYPIESVIAEKFEAMITLDRLNSRMKDFYDLFMIFENCRIDKEILLHAIQNTFRVRKTVCPDKPTIFSHEFGSNPVRIEMWNQFLKRIGFKTDLPFEKIFLKLCEHLEPVYTKIQQ